MRPRTILADDHVLILEGLRTVIENACCDLISTVSDGRALVEVADQMKPDLIVLDIGMPYLNGIEAARQIRKADGRVKFIFLSMHADSDYVREAFRCGGSGYVLKSSAISELATAIRAVLEGHHYISPLVTRQSVSELLGEQGAKGFGKELTPRQREVLQLVAEGKQLKEIAANLNISVKTVEFHKASIMDALGVRTTAELTRYALERGLLGRSYSTA
ncbi:MAG TPA: response regulator transcription factor [Bryobacteraceae bacterium]|nr:response regulator transcription factor [Bryobacteraceae bacterium]